MTLAWAGGIFIRYCKEDTCYTLVDLYCTFDSYIVYYGSSKKVRTALLTLADCVGSLNKELETVMILIKAYILHLYLDIVYLCVCLYISIVFFQILINRFIWKKT